MTTIPQMKILVYIDWQMTEGTTDVIQIDNNYRISKVRKWQYAGVVLHRRARGKPC